MTKKWEQNYQVILGITINMDLKEDEDPYQQDDRIKRILMESIPADIRILDLQQFESIELEKREG